MRIHRAFYSRGLRADFSSYLTHSSDDYAPRLHGTPFTCTPPFLSYGALRNYTGEIRYCRLATLLYKLLDGICLWRLLLNTDSTLVVERDDDVDIAFAWKFPKPAETRLNFEFTSRRKERESERSRFVMSFVLQHYKAGLYQFFVSFFFFSFLSLFLFIFLTPLCFVSSPKGITRDYVRK